MFLLRVALLLAFLFPAALASAAPAMWTVSDEDSKVWLFGSVHLLPADVKWRTQLLEDVLDDTDFVYFETKLDPTGGAQALMTLKSGVNGLGERLDDFLTPEQAKQVNAAAEKVNFPSTTLQMFKPWMAAMMLGAKGMSAGKLDPTKGVDMALMGQVTEERARYFETPEFQLEIFSGMSQDDQVSMLMKGIEEMDQAPEQLNELIASWLAGGDGSEEMVKEIGAEDADFEARLFSNRNRTWVAELTKLLEGKGETALVVVGAGHMAGENGLPKLLEKAGYTVERVQ